MKTDTVRNKRVLKRMYWDEGMSLREIGDYFGVSRQRIHQIFIEVDLQTSGKQPLVRSALNKLKKATQNGHGE